MWAPDFWTNGHTGVTRLDATAVKGRGGGCQKKQYEPSSELTPQCGQGMHAADRENREAPQPASCEGPDQLV